MSTLSLDERRHFYELARDKFETQPKYNLLRDEIEEFNLRNEQARSAASSLTWQQVDFDAAALFA